MFHPNLRECIECRLFDSGRLADNQTCQRLCKDEIITVETLGECVNTHTCTEQMADRPRAFNICCICSYFLFFFFFHITNLPHCHFPSELWTLLLPDCTNSPDDVSWSSTSDISSEANQAHVQTVAKASLKTDLWFILFRAADVMNEQKAFDQNKKDVWPDL